MGMGTRQGQGCQRAIMCQGSFLSRLSIEMTGSRQAQQATNLNWTARGSVVTAGRPEPWR